MDLAAELDTVADAAVQAAIHVLSARFHAADLAIRTKTSGLDVVTDADLASERAIVRVIEEMRPGDGLLGEEGHERDSITGVTWVFDPLDSTANFARGIPIWSVSIAARDGDEVIAAAVACPPVSETFMMTRGTPLRLNAQAMPASRYATALGESLGLVGWERSMSPSRIAEVLPALVTRSGKLRSPGSPALGLAWTAAGRADFAYYEQGFFEWDVAAGLFMCRQRGLVARLEERGSEPRRLLVAPAHLFGELEAIVFDAD